MFVQVCFKVETTLKLKLRVIEIKFNLFVETTLKLKLRVLEIKFKLFDKY